MVILSALSGHDGMLAVRRQDGFIRTTDSDAERVKNIGCQKTGQRAVDDQAET